MNILFYTNPDDLSDKKSTTGYLVRALKEKYAVQTNATRTLEGVDNADIIFHRMDAPLDLEFLKNFPLGSAYHINHPHSIAKLQSKAYLQELPESVLPYTHFTENLADVYAAFDNYNPLVAKPHDGAKGRGVVLFDKNDANLQEKIAQYEQLNPGPYIIQSYVEGIQELGDSRVHVIDYEPVSAIRRIPPQGDFRTNHSIGGSLEKTSITPAIEDLISPLVPFLKKYQLPYVGVDVFADKVIGEVNLVSPGLLMSTDNYNGNTRGRDAFFSLIEKIGKTKF